MKFLITGMMLLALAWTAWSQAPGPVNLIQPPNAVPATVLAWDAEFKECTVSKDQTNTQFTFWVTNVAPTNVLIFDITSTCGCTVAQMPSQPWILEPGAFGPIKVGLDLQGRYGAVMKGINVNTSAGLKALVVRAHVLVPAFPQTEPSAPTRDDARVSERARNVRIARADRQAVFRGDCARCHVVPGRGKTGKELYAAVCGICHESAERAEFVPDLRERAQGRTKEFWRKTIAAGRAGSLMPAFAASEGGPLNETEVASLVEYLTRRFPADRSSLSGGGGASRLPPPSAAESSQGSPLR